MRPPVPWSTMCLAARCAAKKYPLQRQIHHAIPVRFVRFEQRPRLVRKDGVVHEDVDPALGVDESIHHFVNAVHRTHIPLMHAGLHTVTFDEFERSRRHLVVDQIVDPHARPFACQRESDTSTNAFARTRDEGAFAVEQSQLSAPFTESVFYETVGGVP